MSNSLHSSSFGAALYVTHLRDLSIINLAFICQFIVPSAKKKIPTLLCCYFTRL